MLQTDTVRRFLFDRDGALTGWEVGVARVAVDRDDDGRITTLTESVTAARCSCTGRTPGSSTSWCTDDGRSVRYRRDGATAGSAARRRDAGSVEYRWDGDLLIAVVDADGVAAFVNEYDERRPGACRRLSPFGRVSTYRYDDTGLTVFSDAAGVVQAMRHDRIRQPDGDHRRRRLRR